MLSNVNKKRNTFEVGFSVQKKTREKRVLAYLFVNLQSHQRQRFLVVRPSRHTF